MLQLGAAVIGTLFGTVGGGLTAYKTSKRLQDLTEFQFVPIVSQIHSLHCVIAITGWASDQSDFTGIF